MSFFRCNLLPACVLVLAALPVCGDNDATTLESRKAEVVRAALARYPAGENLTRLLNAAASAEALTEIDLRQEQDAQVVRMTVSGDPACDAFTLEGGKRIVLDLVDVVNLHSGEVLRPATPGVIDAVRTSLYTLEPQLTSRVVIDLTTPMRLHIEQGDTCLRVYGEQEAAAAASPALLAEIIFAGKAEEAPDPGTELAPLGADLRALQELEAPASGPSKEAAAAGAVSPSDAEGTQEPVHEAPTQDANESSSADRQGNGLELAALRTKHQPPSLGEDMRAVAAARPNLRLGAASLAAAVDEEAVAAPAQTPEAPETAADRAGRLRRSAASPQEAPPAEDAASPAADAEAPEGGTPTSEEPPTEEAADVAEQPLPPPSREEAPDVSEANTALTERLRAVEEQADAQMLPGALEPLAPPVPAVMPARPKYQGNPLDMPVNLDFRDMEMANVVAILASMAEINVIAGTDLTGTVTLSLKDVPLQRAIQTVLRINGLGMLEEEGIYRIVPYAEAVAAKRTTMLVTLENADVEEIRKVLDDVLVGSVDQNLVSITSNEKTNVVVIAGPEARVNELVSLAHQLDIAEPVLPTVTEAIKLNYADPSQLQELVKTMLTKDVGQVSADTRARYLVVTDVPAVVEQVRALLLSLDLPVRQVAINSMVVDAVLNDDASTGVDWLLSAVRRQSRRDAALGTDRFVGNLQELALDSDMRFSDTPAGALTFGILSGDIDLRGLIQAEVRNQNGTLLSNPTVVTVENKPARIIIAQEIPYIELVQTDLGGSQTNTEFKEVGTTLEVTPRVTHDDHVLVDISGKESGTIGEFNGVPIEDKREVETTLRVKNGQTVFIAGLRKNDNDTTVRKLPILGDIPGLNVLFRSNVRTERVNELLIFLTCNVLPDEVPELTAYEQEKHDEGASMQLTPNAQKALAHDTFHPGEMRDPIWKVRRSD